MRNLTAKRYELFCKMHEDIIDNMKRAADLYNSILSENGIEQFDYAARWYYDGEYEFESDGVHVKWDAYGPRGYHESGCCFIPLECITGDGWEQSVRAAAESYLAEKSKKENASKVREIESKKKELQRLNEKIIELSAELDQ